MSRPRRSCGYGMGRSRRGIAVTALLVVLTVLLAGIGFRVVTHAASPKAVPAVHQWQLAATPPSGVDVPPAKVASAASASNSASNGPPTEAPVQAPETEAPTPLPQPTPTAPGAAQQPPGSRLVIDELAVSAPIQLVGDARGELAVPADPWVVGQWSGGARLSDPAGTVLLAGHVRVGRQTGVGQHWEDLKPGATISTVDEQGRKQHWRAVRLRVYRGTALPEDLFSRRGQHRLALVTCTGPIVQVGGRREYRDNLVIIAEPVAADR